MKRLSIILILFPGLFCKCRTKEKDALVNSRILESKMFPVYDIPAQYPGDKDSIMVDIYKNLIYPKTSHPLKGIVRISIGISSSGQLSDVTVMRGLRKDYDYAAIAAVKKLKKFKPGTMNGKAVENAYGIPVIFK